MRALMATMGTLIFAAGFVAGGRWQTTAPERLCATPGLSRTDIEGGAARLGVFIAK
jgi:hypothetical protein